MFWVKSNPIKVTRIYETPTHHIDYFKFLSAFVYEGLYFVWTHIVIHRDNFEFIEIEY